jgi:nuclease HARBI1
VDGTIRPFSRPKSID